MNTVAAACMPPVFENISIVIPRKKDKNNTSQSGVWKGSIKINNMYRKGLRYPLS